MKYLIDNRVIFNCEDGTLTDTTVQQTISLPIPAARLLEEFALSQGQNLTREYLIDTVWGKHGLQVTDGNLRQYISILRRHLLNFECPEIIVTVPKVGFKINSETTIIPETGLLQHEENSALPAEEEGSQAEQQQKKMIRLINLLPGFLISGICILLISWCAFSQIENESNHLVTPEGCDVTFIKDIPENARSEKISLIKGILAANSLTCSRDNFVIFDHETPVSSGNNSRLMLSFCTKGEGNKAISCENFYRYQEMD